VGNFDHIQYIDDENKKDGDKGYLSSTILGHKYPIDKREDGS
jgi:hypothetical protein